LRIGGETERTAIWHGVGIIDDETATNDGCLVTGELSDKCCNYI
jgi:hypothetical protein